MQSSFLQLFLLLSWVLLSHQIYRETTMRIVHSWRVADFDYLSEQIRREALRRGLFVPNNVAILDADYHAPTRRYFVTSPMFRNGIPASLSEVIKGPDETSFLKPFPYSNILSSNNTSCQGPFSVYRIFIDKCGFMWVLDSGRADIFTTLRMACRPKLLIYDLNNRDREILRYEFPAGVYTDRSILISIITESRQKDCRDSVAYIADVNDHGLLVFDLSKKMSWRIENKLFFPYPPEGTMTVSGVTFDLMDGIFGLALSAQSNRNRKLYFHSFASVRESWVPVSVLENQTLAMNPVVSRTAFVLSEGKRAGQSTVQVMTEDGILIYALIPTNAIACWNSKRPFTIENQHILEKDNENFQFISGMKLKENKLLITSSRLQNYINGNVNGSDIKYRIIVVEDVRRLLQNSPCKSNRGSDFDEFSGGAFTNEGFSNGGPYAGSSIGAGSNAGFSSGISYGGSPSSGLGANGCRNGICDKPYQQPVIHKPKPKLPSRGYYDPDLAQSRFEDSSDGILTSNGTQNALLDSIGNNTINTSKTFEKV